MRKIALVTGGAKGIGAAIVRELANTGYDVVINYLTSKEKADALVKELSPLGVNVFSYQCDVSKEEEVDKMISYIESKLGTVDILINNAAVDISKLWNEKTSDGFRKTLDVNVVGAYNVARRVKKGMMDKKWGRIINISSTNGINSYYPVCLEYDASKAALISLTHNLAIEFAPYANVNAIAPGFIGTESELEGYDEEFLKSEQEKILVGRYGKPEEVAHLVKFLVSDEANYINNSVLRIDGGQYGA
ncbi:MAG: SDR family oxidoreductase [Firmicutes bacterium]|nr:SDR family oxidoreductase [Candidatus Fiminaster equi]